MQNNYFSKVLKLEEYVTDEIKEYGSEIHIHCHVRKRGMRFNGRYSKKVTEEKTRRISHMMLENKQMVLVVTQRRFAFKGTKRWEKLPDIERYKQTTNTFRLNTLRELQRDNYSGSGYKRQKSGMFPMKLLDELEMNFEWRKGVTRVGLDGKYVCTHEVVHHLADLDEGKSIIVLPNLSQEELKKKLLEIPEEDRLAVEEVCTDMDPFYINLAKEVFPKAKIVMDHYHVIAWGLKLMNELRTILQSIEKKKFPVKPVLMKSVHKLTEQEFKKLQPCFEAFPDVKRAWKIIHQLRKVYWQKNWKVGCSQLRKVIWLCEQSQIEQMQDLAKTLKKRKAEILNYYISQTSNAKTEALHSRFETMKRLHCGIRNVDRFAKRLMFCLLPFSVLTELFARSVY